MAYFTILRALRLEFRPSQLVLTFYEKHDTIYNSIFKIDLVHLTIGGMKMSRSASVFGLSSGAKKLVAYAEKSLSGEIVHGDYEYDFPLWQYKMTDGRVLKEFVAHTECCGGTCYFLALRDARGCRVRKSKWKKEEIRAALGFED
jgi:hypothetical protein